MKIVAIVGTLVVMLVVGCHSTANTADPVIDGATARDDARAPAAGRRSPTPPPTTGRSPLRRGLDMSHIAKQHIDVAYATRSESQKLDIYIPDGEGVFPAVILVHGGGFLSGDKESENYWVRHLVQRGFVAATINYRLSGEALFPANIQDVKAAIRFVRGNADAYQVDPDAIGLWGTSAGGNLASLAGTTGGVEELEDLTLGNADESSRVQAVVNWYGPTNFLTMDRYLIESGMGEPGHSRTESPESRVLGAPIASVPGLVAAANPETYITADDPPLFIQHGTHDDTVPVQQSIIFAQKLRDVVGEDGVTLVLLHGAGHGGREFRAPENLARLMAFLDEHLR